MLKTRRKGSGIEKMESKWGLLLAMPAILGFVFFILGPMIASFVISLTDWNIISTPHFTGLQNYQRMFTEDDLFGKSLYVTTYYALGSVPLVIIAAFAVAMLLNQKIKGLSFFRTVYYLPVIVPSIANTMLWLWLFNPDFGLLNSILKTVGLPKMMWIYDETTVMPSLFLMSTWGMGNAMVIFLAGLQGVPTHLYEAAEIDGGNRWHKLRYITIPSMTPTIFFNLIMSLIGAFQVFTEAFVMTDGGPNNSSLFFVLYIYRSAFLNSEMGYASALAWILFLIIMLLTVIIFRTSKHWVYYESEGRK